MAQRILVIGGTRYFGILLVQSLLEQGQHVTLATRGRTPDPFGTQVQRLAVDRRDPQSMQAAFHRTPLYDRVYDQMCYSPRDAALSIAVFAGRVGHYLMTSTIEVYGELHGQLARSYQEQDLDLGAQPVHKDWPWQDPVFAETHYGAGKRQTEAVLAACGALPVGMVRMAHVLGGVQDFTGRLRSYVQRVLAGAPLRHAQGAGPSSFIDMEGAAQALLWAGEHGVRGPLNIAAEGSLTAAQLHALIAQHLGQTPQCIAQPLPSGADFDYAHPHQMDLARAHALGWHWPAVHTRLPALIDAHVQALRGQEATHA